MTIPSLTAINPAPLAATKTGAPTVQATATATDPQVLGTQQPPLVNALDAVLAAARQSAAARQDGLAVLMANALRAATAKALPDAVQKAVDQLLALHMPTDTPPDAQSVKTALQTSGLFTEANLASGASSIPVDVKTALLQLNQAAQAWLARAALAADPKQEAAATGKPENAPAAPPETPSVPPPAAGSPSKAQSPAAPTLPEHAGAALIAKTLTSGSDAALARQTLLQIASLPDSVIQTRTGEARWIFDLPVMTDRGAAVAQVIIERDGRNASGEAPRPVWRVQFALDIEPLGPVRANLAISGEHAWVTIGAERPDSLAMLQAQAATLSDALQAESLEADIAFQSGAAPQAIRRGKPLVDRAS